ncbi:cell division protein CrgA [Georgenia sp. TF02-10]|uniref:cell division protein CrgA n=1 Tax=Georgenia sp. TF02-10 TaxID=2917725 RepID=UPI001FA6C1F4|nr:cell division protein CrgA [Georgenia sp. TF02-10]UNX54989.1 cell division protein CrgA [Georgenia sp. TF02-10]
MPESKKRKPVTATGEAAAASAAQRPSPRWWAPTMVTLMVLGLAVVVVTYLTKGGYPIPGLGNWNLAIGFGVMIVGFFMTMRWR